MLFSNGYPMATCCRNGPVERVIVRQAGAIFVVVLGAGQVPDNLRPGALVQVRGYWTLGGHQLICATAS